MGKTKDAAPGEDGVRLCYLKKGGEKVMAEVVRIVQFMWVNEADKREECLGSRIVARIVASRLKEWVELLLFWPKVSRIN